MRTETSPWPIADESGSSAVAATAIDAPLLSDPSSVNGMLATMRPMMAPSAGIVYRSGIDS